MALVDLFTYAVRGTSVRMLDGYRGCSSPLSVKMIHPRYRPDLDGLRAVAVLLVVGFHAFPSLFPGGLIGVDIFFAISGFLISSIIIEGLQRDGFSFRTFYVRRVRRIFPALLVVLVACMAIGWVVLLPEAYRQLSKPVAAGGGFFSNFVLWNESGYFDDASGSKPLLHLWSLGIEEQFYLVWPLILWLAWLCRVNFLVAILTIGTVSFAMNIALMRSNPVADFYAPFTRAWELLAGALLSYIMIRSTAARAERGILRDGLSALGSILIIVGVITVTKDAAFPGWWALLPIGGTLLIMWAGDRAWLNRLVLSHPAFVSIGLISYPLYLWHWPLLSFARYEQDGVPSSQIRGSVVICSIVLAWLTYRFVETPFRFGSNGRAKSAILVGMMSVVSAFALICYWHNGMDFRFPKIVRDLTSFSYAYQDLYREGSCFLLPNQDFRAFSKCVDPPNVPGRQTMFLWGDSHAAHFYPGYQAALGGTVNIVQRNASNCPPLLGLDVAVRPFCKSINDQDFNLIAAIRPNTVVLSAAWTYYDWRSYLAGTIERLRSAGVRHILLIGPTPQWTDKLANLMFNEVRTNPLHRVPTRMTRGLRQEVFAVDHDMWQFAAENFIDYVSPTSILCNPEGCLTRLGDTGDMITQWDSIHLTAEGSIYVVSRFALKPPAPQAASAP